MSYNNNAINRDDPQALQKLTDKLTKCQETQEYMKTVNAYYRKNGILQAVQNCPMRSLMFRRRELHFIFSPNRRRGMKNDEHGDKKRKPLP